jgi:UDP-N-acetylglucosamine--N-acetylmuramyl-(pentapeptide) pyrophosphoryl-undecaprenol N-acetylglucosamine transferase
MNFVLAAGGTGGHMIPAHALAAELKSRGHGVLLITDERGARFPGLFKDVPVHILPAGRLRRSPMGLIRGVRSLLAGRREARALYRDHRPDAVVGFGGYPAVPALMAATAMKIPTVLHEQNAVLGRANRFLAGEAVVIATAYSDIERLKRAHAKKTVLVGNPVREARRSRRSTNIRRSGYSSPAAARARPSLAAWFPRGWACWPPRCACACK